MDSITLLWATVAVLAVLFVWVGCALTWGLKAEVAHNIAMSEVLDVHGTKLDTQSKQIVTITKADEELGKRFAAALNQLDTVQAQANRFLSQIAEVNNAVNSSTVGMATKFEELRRAVTQLISQMDEDVKALQSDVTAFRDTYVTRQRPSGKVEGERNCYQFIRWPV